jgi:ABC-type multidrug transport system ATPase subunit
VTFCQYLLSGILLGLFAWKAGEKSSSANDDAIATNDDDTWINDDSFSMTSTLFFLLVIQIYIHIYAIPDHLSHLTLLKHEINSSVYHPLSAYATLQLFHWSIHFFGSILISTLIYLMLHLSFSSSLHFLYYYLSILLYIYNSLSLLTFLCLLLPSPSSTAITYLYLLLSSIILLLSGYIQPLSNLSYPLRILTHLSYGRYTFQLLMVLSYGDTHTGQWYLKRYSFDNTSEHVLTDCLLSSFVWFLTLQVGIIWCLYPYQSRVLYAHALGYLGHDGLPSSSPVTATSPSRMSDLESNNESAGGGRHGHSLLHNDHSLQSDQLFVDTTYHTPITPSSSTLSVSHLPLPGDGAPVVNGFQPVLHSVTVIPLDPSKRTSLQFRNVNFYLKSRNSSASFLFNSLASSPSSTTTQSLSLIRQTFPSFSSGPTLLTPTPIPTPPRLVDVSSDPNYELLLRNLSGQCSPYQLWCVLDSEDDTTTLTVLLHLLGGISKSYGLMTAGQVLVNGIVEMNQDTQQQPYDNVVYVSRGDSPNHRYLTVREVLYYQILLRRKNQRTGEGFRHYAEICLRGGSRPLGSHRPEEGDSYLLDEWSCDEHLDSLLRLFQLEEISDVPLLVGDSSNPHISPSQLRCLTIAMESIHSPGVYLLQDPFEGLDWYHTERVLRVLRGLVDGGRCVICTISNPTERMVCYFNNLMLLHRGLLLYSGEMSEVKNHFDHIGYQATPQQTLLDYLYDICHGRAMLSSLAPPPPPVSQHQLQQQTFSPVDGESRKRAPSSLLTPEDLANIRHSMDGYTSTLSPMMSARNTISSRRSQGSAGEMYLTEPTHGGGERFTSTSTDVEPPFQFVIDEVPPPQPPPDQGADELVEIPVPYGPVVARRVPLVLPSARVTLYRRCVSAFRNVSSLPLTHSLSHPLLSFLSGG